MSFYFEKINIYSRHCEQKVIYRTAALTLTRTKKHCYYFALVGNFESWQLASVVFNITFKKIKHIFLIKANDWICI